MPDDPSYRLYLDKCFKDLDDKFEGLTSHLHAQFSNVHDTLGEIKIQTTKTNGRVNELEKDFINHPLSCSKGKEIEEIKEYISNSNVIKSKNRRIFESVIKILTVIIIGAGMGLSAYFGFKNTNVPQQLEETKSEIKNEIRNMDGISKTTRGGYVKFNDFGFTDSIKVR